MLKKELMVPGNRMKVRLGVLKSGVTGAFAFGQDQTIPHMSMTAEAGGLFDGTRAIHGGTELEVVRAPKKTQGINTAIVKEVATGVQGHVYWCELRANCDHIGATAVVPPALVGAKPKAKDLLQPGVKIKMKPTDGTNYAALYSTTEIDYDNETAIPMDVGQEFECLTAVEKLNAPKSGTQLIKLRRIGDGAEGFCPWANLMGGYNIIQ
jgi:hypothetical protein